MSHILYEYFNHKVAVITVDGHYFIGTLLGGDYSTNLILQDTVERIIYPADETEEQNKEDPQGLRILRGDNVVICGLVDEAIDESIDWMKVKGEPIRSTKHT